MQNLPSRFIGELVSPTLRLKYDASFATSAAATDKGRNCNILRLFVNLFDEIR
jgi:hypothetical protein